MSEVIPIVPPDWTITKEWWIIDELNWIPLKQLIFRGLIVSNSDPEGWMYAFDFKSVSWYANQASSDRKCSFIINNFNWCLVLVRRRIWQRTIMAKHNISNSKETDRMLSWSCSMVNDFSPPYNIFRSISDVNKSIDILSWKLLDFPN